MWARHKSRFSGNRRAIGNITRSRWRSNRRRSYWSRRWSRLINNNIAASARRGNIGWAAAGERDGAVEGLARFTGAVERKGMTLVPLSIYFNGRGRAKVELALAKGKNAADKRGVMKERDWKRDKARIMKDHG